MLDARPEGIIYRDIVPEYVQVARTIYEGLEFFFFFGLVLCHSFLCKFYYFFSSDRQKVTHVNSWLWAADLGHVAVDVNYLNVGDDVQDYQLYIC